MVILNHKLFRGYDYCKIYAKGQYCKQIIKKIMKFEETCVRNVETYLSVRPGKGSKLVLQRYGIEDIVFMVEEERPLNSMGSTSVCHVAAVLDQQIATLHQILRKIRNITPIKCHTFNRFCQLITLHV